MATILSDAVNVAATRPRTLTARNVLTEAKNTLSAQFPCGIVK